MSRCGAWVCPYTSGMLNLSVCLANIWGNLIQIDEDTLERQSVGSETAFRVYDFYRQHDAASPPQPAIPFTDLPSGEFETPSMGSIRPSVDTYPGCNNATAYAYPNHDDKGAVALNATCDGAICPESSFSDSIPRLGHVATTGLFFMGGAPSSIPTQVRDGPDGIVDKSLSLPSRRLKSVKPNGRPNSVSQPTQATAHEKSKSGTFSLSSVEHLSQPTTSSARNTGAKPHHIPEYPLYLLGRPSQVLIRGLRSLKCRAKKLLPSSHPLPINHSIISSPSSPQQPTVSGNSFSDSHIQNMNRLFLLNHCSLDVEAIWDVGKFLGVEFPGHDHEILDRIKTMEDRDKEAWEKAWWG
ncbi:hypothetical protein Ancab_001924 [Ancistrocladus abbreviatus]